MRNKEILTLIKFEDECLKNKYTSFIFTDENQNQDNYNIRFALTFDSMRVYYDNIYDTVFFGNKNNCIEIKRIIKVEKDLDIEFGEKYVFHCKSRFGTKRRKFGVIAVR